MVLALRSVVLLSPWLGLLGFALPASQSVAQQARAAQRPGDAWAIEADDLVIAERKISTLHGGFTDDLVGYGSYGRALAFPGDVDGDGVNDVAVCQPGSRPATGAGGTVWVLFLTRDGGVRDVQKIDAESLSLPSTATFGMAAAGVGDMDGNGVPDLAVGVPRRTSQAHELLVYFLFLQRDGTLLTRRAISYGLIPFDSFGMSMAGLGDLDGDGLGDLAVGTTGRIHVLFLDSAGKVLSQRVIHKNAGGFGSSLASLGDLDGDGVGDLAVGAPTTTTRNFEEGAIWILLLNADGSVKSERSLGGTHMALPVSGYFGSALAPLGDLDGDGVLDLAAGAPSDPLNALNGIFPLARVLFLRADGSLRQVSSITTWDTSLFDPYGGFSAALAASDMDGDGRKDLLAGAFGEAEGDEITGTVWRFLLDASGGAREKRRFSDTDAIENTLGPNHLFGTAVAPLGDLDGNGATDLAVSRGQNGSRPALVWIQFLEPDGSVLSHHPIDAASGFTGIPSAARFGRALAAVGDLDGDGVTELAVGQSDAVWILFLSSEGRVLRHTLITTGSGGFPDVVSANEGFGDGLCALGDIDGDGVGDLAVGSPLNRGIVRILTLTREGTVERSTRLAAGEGGFTGPVAPGDNFGAALGRLGDLDGNGIDELAVGAPGHDALRGCVWILGLRADGTVRSERRIAPSSGGFDGILDAGDALGSALASIPDRDGNGVRELLVGAPGDDEGRPNTGAVWLLRLDARGEVTSHARIGSSSGGSRARSGKETPSVPRSRTSATSTETARARPRSGLRGTATSAPPPARSGCSRSTAW